MSDLRTLMLQAAAALPTATDSRIAEADLTRARRALGRRRAGRLVTGSGLVAVAAVGAFALAVPGVFSGPPATTTASTDGTAPAPLHTVTGTALVSYTGKQPAGYTLDKVPSGWVILSADAGNLLLAPEGFTENDKKQPPPGSVSFEGKIVVMLSAKSSLPSDVPMDKITVDGRPGMIAHMKGSGSTRTLFLEQPSGAYLTIQVWSGLDWSNAQIVEFAESVHVNKGALVTVG